MQFETLLCACLDACIHLVSNLIKCLMFYCIIINQVDCVHMFLFHFLFCKRNLQIHHCSGCKELIKKIPPAPLLNNGSVCVWMFHMWKSRYSVCSSGCVMQKIWLYIWMHCVQTWNLMPMHVHVCSSMPIYSYQNFKILHFFSKL